MKPSIMHVCSISTWSCRKVINMIAEVIIVVLWLIMNVVRKGWGWYSIAVNLSALLGARTRGRVVKKG